MTNQEPPKTIEVPMDTMQRIAAVAYWAKKSWYFKGCDAHDEKYLDEYDICGICDKRAKEMFSEVITTITPTTLRYLSK